MKGWRNIIIIIDLLIQATIAILIPYFIADRIFYKNGKIHSWPFWVFFFINWFAQAFLAVLLVHSLGQFETWLCDLSVFIMPIIGYLIFKKNHNDIQSNDYTQVNKDDTTQSAATNHNNDTLAPTPPLTEQSDSTQFEMIKKLKELYDFGALTEDEFLSKKTQILDKNNTSLQTYEDELWKCACGNVNRAFIKRCACGRYRTITVSKQVANDWPIHAQKKHTSINEKTRISTQMFVCGKCGLKGPYEGNCPECGSSIRRYIIDKSI